MMPAVLRRPQTVLDPIEHRPGASGNGALATVPCALPHCPSARPDHPRNRRTRPSRCKCKCKCTNLTTPSSRGPADDLELRRQ